MGAYDKDDAGGKLPPDLEKTTTAAAAAAASTSKDSYEKTVRLALVKNKKYKFWFQYKYEDPETKEVRLSESSPIWQETFDIPNLTKKVKNLTLTQGFKSYGVKFDLDPLSVQEDVIIFESLTSNFATQSIVYVGTSTNVTIQTDGVNAFAPRWVKVRSRDRWDDLNISEETAGPVTPLNSEINTTIPPGVPTNVLVTAFNETSDPSNYTGYINASWTAPAGGAKGYNVGIWESTPGTNPPNREFKVDATSSKINGLFVGKSYYIQVKALSEFGTPSAWVAPAVNYPVVIPGNTAVPGAVTVSGTGTPRSIVLSWTVPSSNANLVVSGGSYIAKLYSNSLATGEPLQTKTCFSNSATFAGLTTGTSYWVTIQPYTGGSTPVAGTISSVYGPLIPIAVEPPDIQANFILANNQFQVGGTSGANDVHLSAYPKTVGGLLTNGRIYIGGPETSASDPVGLYNSNGTPFYADNLGRFSLGDKLTWSGGALNVIGTIDVTGASTFSSYIVSGATNSAFIGIGKQVPYRVSDVLQTGANGLTGIVINKSGTVSNSDYIRSDGSFRLGEGGLTFNGTQLNLIGNIQAIGGTFTGNVRVTTGSIISGAGTVASDGSVSGARIVIQQSGIYAHDGVALNDVPTVSIIAATGSLSATKGIIGTWNIESTGFSSSNTKIESNGTITLGDITGTLSSVIKLSATDNFRLWIGSQSSTVARDSYFAVSKEGKLYASGAVISGNASFSGTLTVGTTLADGTTIDTVKQKALQGVSDAGLAAQAAEVARLKGVEAYDKAVAAGQSAAVAKQAADDAAAAAALKIAEANINTVLNYNTTIINGSRITTGTIDVARLNITGGTATNTGFVIDGNGIRAYSSFTKTLDISSDGTISLGSASFGFTLDSRYITSRNVYTSGYTKLVLDGYDGSITGGRITGATIEGNTISGNTITGGTIIGTKIQTSTSGNRVEMVDATTDSLRVIYGGTTRGQLLAAASSGILMHAGATANANATTYGLFLATPTSVTMAADSTNYLIATTSNVQMKGDQFAIDAGANGVVFNATVGQDRGQVYFQRTTTTLGTLASTTTSGANAFLNSSTGLIARSTSSRRYKTNIESVEFTDSQLMSLRPVKFQGIADAERGDTAYRVGLIAEEVAEVVGLEDIVEYNEDGTPENINYNSLAPILISVIKRVLNRLDALEAK